MLPQQHQSEVRVADEPNGDRHDRVVDATGERLLAGKPKVEMTARKVQRARRRNPPTSRVWRTGRRPLARLRATVQSNGRAAWPATSRSSGRSPSSDPFAVSPAAKTTPRLTRRSSPSGRRREPTFSRPRHEPCGIRESPKRDAYARTASVHRLGRTLFWKLRPPMARSNRSVTG